MLSLPEMIIFIIVISIATSLTRFIPFLIFRNEEKIPKYVLYLGDTLPFAITGFLVAYCLKDTVIFAYPYAIPELISITFIIALHLYKKNTLLSVTLGTIMYMILVNIIFV